MPRNATTGIYDRVVNSFSEPVLGEVIDPNDATAFWDDLTDALNTNPPTVIGQWSVTGLSCLLNSFDTAHLTMDMSATWVSLGNSNTDNGRRGGVATALPCNLGATGAGGRDTGSAPVSGENWWFYFIKGAATSLNTLASRTSPYASNGTTLGPVLPTGYDSFAPAFPVVISDADNLVYDSHQRDEVTRGTFSGYVVGTTLHLSGAVTGVALAIGNKISGSTTLANTLLVSGSGVTWTINKSQTVGSVGTPVALVSTTPYPSSPEVFENFVEFSAEILKDLSAVALFTPYEWTYDDLIPADAVSIHLQVSLQVSCNDATLDRFTGGFVFNWVDPAHPNAGNGTNISLNSFGYKQPAYADPIDSYPVTALMSLTFTWVNGNSATNVTTVTVAMPIGYSFER